MQTQPISPYAEAPALHEQHGVHTGPEHAMGADNHMHADESPKKKSVMGKVKDKARKLKTKIKKPKSAGAADNNESSSASSSEDESGSEPHQQMGEQSREEREVVSTPGLQGEAYEAIPDPHVRDAPAAGTACVEQRFGHMSLGDKPDTTKLQEEVPSAPGHVSAGVTPYLASHNLGRRPYVSEASRGIPLEEGNVDGKDLLVTPASTDIQEITALDYEKTPEVSKTSDNTAAWYTPTSEDKLSDDQRQKPLKECVSESVVATAATGAGVLGVKSLSDESKNVENRDAHISGEKKGMLEQAKERLLGSSTKFEGEEKLQTSESKPSITERATDTTTGLKDAIVAKLGYGSNKNSTADGDDSAAVDAHDQANKFVLQKIQESAAGATGAVASKLGYGDKPSQGIGEEVVTGDKKSYTQKAYDAAYGAKDAIAAKLGYSGTASTENPTDEGEQKSYLQKMQETAVGAKDTVASKLGYANRELPASTESAYNDDQNVPASTAARFHPGEEDRALSQLITEKMSTGAITVKDTLLRPFGASKSGPPTPTTTPPPSSAVVFADDPVQTTVTGTNDVVETAPNTAGQEKPGIVGKVTGAMSSLLGTTGSEKKRVDEVTGKANEDSQAAAVCDVEMH